MNRIGPYFKEQIKQEKIEKPKCLIVSNVSQEFVAINYCGERLVWRWRDGKLLTPGNEDGINITPLAARCVIKEDIEHIMAMDGVEDIVYVNTEGHKTNGPLLIPREIKDDDMVEEKSDLLLHLYSKYIDAKFNLSEEVIILCLNNNILKDFLSLVNM